MLPPSTTPTKDVTVRVFEVRFKDAGPNIQTILFEGDTIDLDHPQIITIQSEKNGNMTIDKSHVAMTWMTTQTRRQFDTFVPQAVASEMPAGTM